MTTAALPGSAIPRLGSGHEVLTPRHAAPEAAPAYDIPIEGVQQIVGDYLEDNPALPDSRFVGVAVHDGADITNAARWLECQVFDKFFENGPNKMEDLYGSVEQDSTWFLVLDRGAKLPVGVLRVVDGEAAKSTTIKAALQDRDPEDHYTGPRVWTPPGVIDPEKFIRDFNGVRPEHKVWDVATIAVADGYRGKAFGFDQVAITGMLERMFIREALHRGIDKAYSLLDVNALKVLKRVGIPFRDLYGPQRAFHFAGSEQTLAMIGDIPEFLPSVARRYKEISSESFLANVLKHGGNIMKALRRRAIGQVAGMAALGLRVDRSIYMDAPVPPEPVV